MTRADLIAAVRTASGKPMMSERECLAIVRGVLGVVREPTSRMTDAAHASMVRENCGYEYSVNVGHRAMIDALLGEIRE